MKVICPNLNNKKVKSQFNELVDATSENAAYHIWSHNNGNAIDRDPNGSPSKLFADLLSHFNGDRRLAIQAKAKAFSKSFTEANNWLETETEPSLTEVLGESVKPTIEPAVRNEEMSTLLRKLYPQIQVDTVADLGEARGKALVESNEAGRVLLSAATEQADTLPHEYAHHYVAWFRDSEPVKKGTKLFGSEEAFVDAIGKQSLKALKWYNRLFSWFKGLFNDKQYYLAQVTNSFLKGEQLGSKLNVQPEIHYQLVQRTQKAETSKKIDDVYNKIMRGLEARVGELSRYKLRDTKKEEDLENLYQQMDTMETEKSIMHFIDYMAQDMFSASRRMDDMTRRMNDAILNGTEFNVNSDVLMQIKAGFLGFYAPLIKNMQSILDDRDSFQWIPDKDERALMQETLLEHAGMLKNFADSWETLVSYNAKKLYKEYATAHGSPTTEEFMEKLDHIDEDINMFTRFTASPMRLADEGVRILASKIQKVKNEVYAETLKTGRKLIEKLENVKKADVQLFFERDSKGKKTGYMTRDLNYGQYLQDLNAFQLKMAEKYNLETIFMRPADKDQAREYNRETNAWLSEHSERKYKPGYYDLYNNLSNEAKFARDELQLDIDFAYSKHIGADGKPAIEKFTDEEWKQIKRLEKKKANLGNLFYEDGMPKTGLDLEIAEEIKKLNDELLKNVQYKTNIDKFKIEAAKKQKELSPERFKIWMNRNTVEKIRQKFFEDLASLEKTPQTPEYEALNNKKKELLKRVRMENGDFDIENMSTELKTEVAEVDAMLDRARTYGKKAKSALKFDDIAVREVNPEYFKQLKQSKETLTDAEYQAWLDSNTYLGTDGTRKPASFWVTIKPKDRKKYMFLSPTTRWSEVDKASNFFNPNFDESKGEVYIPKRSKYDNSRNYNKIANNPKLKAMYDMILSVMERANNMLHFQKRPNNYKLPQIEGGLMNTLKEKDGIFKKIKTLITDAINVKPDDDRYVVEKAVRPDGSPIEMVPTRYMKMLEQPDLLTDDIVGSVIKYYEMAENYQRMSAIKSDLEVMTEQLGLREFKHMKGTESNIYKRATDLMEMQVYGRSRKNKDVKIPLTNITFSASKIAFGLSDLTRILGISHNPFVILTGFVTNIMHTAMDAMSGIYYDDKDLLSADRTMAKEYHKAMLGIGKSNYKTKTLMLLEINEVSTSLDNMFGNLQHNRLGRTVKQHFWYGGHAMGDFATKGRMALSVYFNNKLYNGEFISKTKFMTKYYMHDTERGNAVWKSLTTSLYDAYEEKDGNIQIKPEYRSIITQHTEHRIKNTIQAIATRIDGQLSDMDKAAVHAGYLSQFLTIFRNFMLQMIQNKMGSMVYNYNTETIEGGEWRMTVQYLMDKYFKRGSMYTLREQTQQYAEAQYYAKRVMKRCALEIGLAWVVIPYLIAPLFASDSGDDDDYLRDATSYLTTRTMLELRAANNPVAFMDLIKSPTAAVSIYDSWSSLLSVLTNDPFKEIKRGPYKGYTNFQKTLIKLTPIKFYLEAQDPKSKQRYLENQIMR